MLASPASPRRAASSIPARISDRSDEWTNPRRSAELGVACGVFGSSISPVLAPKLTVGERWAEQRDQAYVEMKLSPEPDKALGRLRRELDKAADAFVAGLPENDFAGIEAGHLKLHRRDALEISKEVRALRSAVETHMPEIGIEDLLVAVDRRCRFIRELTPLGAYTSRIDNLYVALLATLLAHGTNLGLAQVAQAARINVETLPARLPPARDAAFDSSRPDRPPADNARRRGLR
jgi:hypothetical protein